MTDGHGSGLRARVHAWFSLRWQSPDERGFSLIEILIAVVLLGALTVGMVGSLYTLTYVSGQQRSISVAEAEGRRLVEQIRAHQYVTCSPDDTAEERTRRYRLIFNPGNGPDKLSAEIVDIHYWDGTEVDPDGVGSPNLRNDCSVADCGLQKITLRATASDSTAEFTFYKRSELPAISPACQS